MLCNSVNGFAMTKAELLKQKLEIAKMLANVKTPNEKSLSYDSGWKEPNDPTLLSYSYINT
ncbi:hypothetical protein CRP1_gp02 [Roseobacter phage CRP-1]|nr:hypothetical protein CRP1_gp02 [Roseobacter phage CRP-1]